MGTRSGELHEIMPMAEGSVLDHFNDTLYKRHTSNGFCLNGGSISVHHKGRAEWVHSHISCLYCWDDFPMSNNNMLLIVDLGAATV